MQAVFGSGPSLGLAIFHPLDEADQSLGQEERHGDEERTEDV